MKKLALIFIALFVFIQPLLSQTPTKKVQIKWGAQRKESKRTTLSDIVGYDATGIYAIKYKVGLMKRAELMLEHYDNEMNFTKSVKIDFWKRESKYFRSIVQMGGIFYVFSTALDKETKLNKLYVQTLDKETLELKNDQKEIAEINFLGFKRKNAGDFNFRLSSDSSKILVYYNLPYEKGESEKYGFHVFDDQFNLIWEKEVTLPYEDQLFIVKDYTLSNEGNIYLLGKIYKDKVKEKRFGSVNFKYQILSYTNNGLQLKEYPVEMEDMFLTDMKITLNDQKEIICGGFYSEQGTSSIKGSYFLKIDEDTKEITSKHSQEFSVDFITLNLKERKRKKAKKKAEKGKNVELYKIELDEIILKDGGGAILIGEQYFKKTHTYTMTSANGVTSTRTVTTYHYNDIIVVSVSPSGEIEWTDKIAKRQVTSDDGGFYSSYVLSVVGDKLYFVFNDHPENLYYNGKGKVKLFSRQKDSVVSLVEFDSESRQTREALFSTREAGIMTRPKVCEQVSSNELVIFGQRKKKHKFAKIKFLEE